MKFCYKLPEAKCSIQKHNNQPCLLSVCVCALRRRGLDTGHTGGPNLGQKLADKYSIQDQALPGRFITQKQSWVKYFNPAPPPHARSGGDRAVMRGSHAGAVMQVQCLSTFSRGAIWSPRHRFPDSPRRSSTAAPQLPCPQLLAATRLPGWPPLLPLPSALGPLPSQYQAGGHDEAGKDHRDVEKRRVLVERYQKHRSHRGLQS